MKSRRARPASASLDDDSSSRRGVAETPSVGQAGLGLVGEEGTRLGRPARARRLFSLVVDDAIASETRARDGREKIFFSSLGRGFRRAESRSCASRRVFAKTHFRFGASATRTPHFRGASFRARGGGDGGDATETRRIKGARALERVFVRSLPGETRVERGRARGEGGESSVDPFSGSEGVLLEF